MRGQEANILSLVLLFRELQGFCFKTVCTCMFLIIMCLHIKLFTKDERCALNARELKFHTPGEVSCVDMNMAHRVLLCCSQKPGFSTSRQTGISFNPVKLQKTQSQLGLCLVEPYCWALLPAGLDQP